MKIATKTGDNGTTGLLFGLRVSKTDKRIAAVGDVDELNAAIGLIRPALWNHALPRHEPVDKEYYAYLKKIQHNLTLLMGELATEESKLEQYASKYSAITEEDLAVLDAQVIKLENTQEIEQKDWVLYGGSDIGSKFDFASKVCRRAERSYLHLNPKNVYRPVGLYTYVYRPVLGKYLNRLSDFFHLLGRYYDYICNL
jgi:cob(I)alamin adenosyltransferase